MEHTSPSIIVSLCKQEKKLHATHTGKLKIGDFQLSCALLSNGERVLVARNVAKVLGKKGGGAYWQNKKSEDIVLPEYISAKYLRKFISSELMNELLAPIKYYNKYDKEVLGIKSHLISKICDVWVKANNSGEFGNSLEDIANKAYLLLLASSECGFTALIDDAVGFKRDKDELQKILERYLQPYARKWVKTFDKDFFGKLCNLYGLNIKNGRTPWVVGKLIMDIIYDRLAPGITKKLKQINPTDEKGHKKNCHHQLLTEDEGLSELKSHLKCVMFLMDASTNKDQFKSLLDKAAPKFKNTFILEN